MACHLAEPLIRECRHPGERMQLSDAGLNMIKQFEGFRSTTYIDTAGLPTIGYGHKLLTGESYPDGITEAQAVELLSADAGAASLAVEHLVTVALAQGQFDALVDFCFNLGQGRLASSTLLRELNAGQYDDARQQLLLWDHSNGQVVPGLQARRQAEFALWGGAPSAA
jgi:lysozyme